MPANYVVTDRTTTDEYEITVADGIVTWAVIVSAASAEPIFEDDTNAGTYWKLFIDNGLLNWETTVTVQDDDVTLVDSVTGTSYRLGVTDGVFYIFTTDVVTVGRFRVARLTLFHNTAKVNSSLLVARI